MTATATIVMSLLAAHCWLTVLTLRQRRLGLQHRALSRRLDLHICPRDNTRTVDEIRDRLKDETQRVPAVPVRSAPTAALEDTRPLRSTTRFRLPDPTR